jgi:hypothetical protein
MFFVAMPMYTTASGWFRIPLISSVLKFSCGGNMAEEKSGRIDLMGAVTLVGGLAATLAFFFGWYLPTERRIKTTEDEIARLSAGLGQISAVASKGLQGPPGPQGERGPPGDKGPSGPSGATADFAAVEQRLAQLSAKVEALTKARPATSTSSIAVPPQNYLQASEGDFRGGCLDVVPGESKSFNLRIPTSVKKQICWRDGRVLAETLELRETDVIFRFPNGRSTNCSYVSGKCEIDYPEGNKIVFSTEKLAGDAGALLHLSFK